MNNRNLSILTAALALVASAGLIGKKKYDDYYKKKNNENLDENSGEMIKDDPIVDSFFENDSTEDNKEELNSESNGDVKFSSFEEFTNSIKSLNKETVELKDEPYLNDFKSNVIDDVTIDDTKSDVINEWAGFESEMNETLKKLDNKKV